MRRVLGWMALVVGTAVALASSWAAYTLADHSWNQVVDYRGPYARAAVPATPAGPKKAPARRVVLVIVDGLREDVSRSMPALTALRNKGVDGTVVTAQPSLSYPDWTTILSGAPQRITGVTTNWYADGVRVETLVDAALRAGKRVVVSAPTDFEKLYGVSRTRHTYLKTVEPDRFMSREFVDNAIRLTQEASPTLVLVHLPDVDEAGHAQGGASARYASVAMEVDVQLGRLVSALADPGTAFVVVSDHGHIGSGGHGGWEAEVTKVPLVMAGPGVPMARTKGSQDQVAPTVAFLAGLPAPRNATGAPLSAVTGLAASGAERFSEQRRIAYDAYTAAVTGVRGRSSADVGSARRAFEAATAVRLAAERGRRILWALAMALAAVAVLVVIGALSWRALVAAVAGVVGYNALYGLLFFVVHGYTWSLSAFNSEARIKAFMNGRLLEAAIAGLFAAAVAADVYLVLRRPPERPRGRYLAGWLSLGTATVLAVASTLWLQAAWYTWRWGPSLTWLIPDLHWGFKYDLDLVQLSALGASALLAPAVTYLVGRYHPLPNRGHGAGTGTAPAPKGG